MENIKYILLVGAPGSGKTWVMKKLIHKFKLNRNSRLLLFLFRHNTDIAVLGKYEGHLFDGSDRLSMAVMRGLPTFINYAQRFKFVIAEGDRFTNKTYIGLANPYIIKITDDGSIGRRFRNSNQSDRQIKSLVTRVNNTKEHIKVADSNTALKLISKIIKQ